MLEPTEKVKTFLVEANELAIVDARVIKDLNPQHPLIKGAIIVPGSAVKNAFNVAFDYDDKANLSGLTIVPTESKQFMPLSNGGAPKPVAHMNIKAKSKNRPNHEKGEKGLMPDPVKGVVAKVQHQIARKPAERQMTSDRERAKRSAEGKAKAAKAAMRDQPIAAESKAIMDFIKDITASRTVREEALNSLPNKHLAKGVLDKLFVLSLGGWEMKDGKLVNEVKNQFADPAKWECKDGLLYTKGGKQPDIDFDMIYEARSKLQIMLDQTNAKEFQTIEESLASMAGKQPILG
jgi:hypothetical protein